MKEWWKTQHDMFFFEEAKMEYITNKKCLS